MRKFSKVFAVALTLCLVIGMFCTSVYAEELSAKKDLKIPNAEISNVVRIDFEENGNGDSSYSAGKSSGNKTTYGWNAVRTGTIQTTLVKTQIGLDGVTTNNYLRQSRLLEGSSIDQSAPYWEFLIGKYATPTHLVSDYSYAVADYDFGCDEYEYTLNGEVCYGETIPEGATDVKLNYPSTFNHYMILRAGNSKGATDLTSYLQVYVVLNPANNKHYCSADTKYDEKDVLLSDIAGAWNHISMVVETNRSKSSDSMLRYYCNGQLFTEAKVNTKGAEYVQFDSVRFNVSAGVVTSGEHYTFCIDNLACNYYGLDYDSGDAYGIDDYYADPNHKSKPLNNCSDMVYNGDYTYYGTKTPYSAVLNHVDGTVDYSYNIEKALAMAKDGDFITINKDVVDYVPASQDIKEITFIAESNAKFTLAGEAQEFYKLQHTNNRYTVKIASENEMKLTWYDSEGDNRNAIKVQNLLPLFVPNTAAAELNIYGSIDKASATPTIEILQKWEWDMNNDGISDGLDISALTVADINELREQGINELSLVPKYEKYNLKYEIFVADEEGNLGYFVPDGDYTIFSDESLISKTLEKLDSGSTATVVAVTDISLASAISIPKNTTVNFDINGKTLSAGADAFTVNAGATLNLYSSVMGGVAEASNAVITTKNADSCTINIGAYVGEGVEIAGGNLKLLGNSIVSPDSQSNTQTNTNKIYINVVEGTYVADTNAFVLTTDCVYSVNGATIVSNGAAFSAVNAASGASFALDNSIAYAQNFIGSWNDSGCRATIIGSIISGFSAEANVSLDVYNKVQYNDSDEIAADGSNIAVAKDVKFAMANNDAVTEVIVINGEEINFSYNVLTFEAETDREMFKDYVLVTWLNTADESHASTAWYPGSIVKTIAADFGICELNNGWYNTKYNTWKNVSEGMAEDNFTVSQDVENKFAPVATQYVEALEAKISLQVSEVFGYNIYLPVADSKVAFDGFYIGSNKISNGVFENVTLDGVAGYIRLAGVVDVNSLVSDTIIVKYSIEGTVMTKKIQINVIDYVQAVANAYECGSDECKIVFAMMNYKLESYMAATGVENDEFTLTIGDFLRTHGSECSCLDIEYTANESAVDYTAIEDKLVSFNYYMDLDSANGYSSKFLFSIKLKNVSSVEGKIGETDLEFVAYAFDGYTEYCAEIELSDLNEVITLSVSDDASVNVQASYDIVKHIEIYGLDIHKAFYIISESAKADEE